MKAPVKERIVGIGFKELLPLERYSDLVVQVKDRILQCANHPIESEKEISRAVVLDLPDVTDDGSMPDWTKVRMGVDRSHRFSLGAGRYVQLRREGITFHILEDGNGASVRFVDLLSFYEAMVKDFGMLLDVVHSAGFVWVHYLNHLEGDEMIPFLSNNGATLNVGKLIKMPNIGLHASNMIPGPPTYQTTSYVVGGNPEVHLKLDVCVPPVKQGRWAFDFAINGQSSGVHLNAANRWGAADVFPAIHKNVFRLFKGLLSEDALDVFEIQCSEVG